MFYASVKKFCRKWEGKTLPKWLLIFKQLEKFQNEYYLDNLNLISSCRRTCLHVFMFSISLLKRQKGICDHIENVKLSKGKFIIFHDVKK